MLGFVCPKRTKELRIEEMDLSDLWVNIVCG
jgi:hypothetical protein